MSLIGCTANELDFCVSHNVIQKLPAEQIFIEAGQKQVKANRTATYFMWRYPGLVFAVRGNWGRALLPGGGNPYE